MTTVAAPAGVPPSSLSVLKNRPFLLLWLAQASTQIGGNMVIYGLTVVIFSATKSNSAVSALLLTFLVPAVLFSAVAGVYVDRHDGRLILIATNLLRAAAFGVIFFASDQIWIVYAMNITVSTITTFFGPAEASMIPQLVPRSQLLAANGLFTITLNAAFALGFALLGPLVVTLAGPQALLLLVAILYLVAAGFCVTLPASAPAPKRTPRGRLETVVEAERAVGSTFSQLREGLAYIATHRNISWSLIYLGTTASLVGVLGVLGPDFASAALGLAPKDFVVVVLPLGFGIVMGILLLNSYGKLLARRRVIEIGMIALGVLLAMLSVAGPVTRFLHGTSTPIVNLSALISLLSVVIGIAFLVGIAYASVAIPSQTQLQEDLPEEVRGRVFGVLNMLVSVASFLPIIVVGPISDLVGTPRVIFAVGVLVLIVGIASIIQRGPIRPAESAVGADTAGRRSAPVDPLAVVLQSDLHLADGTGNGLVADGTTAAMAASGAAKVAEVAAPGAVEAAAESAPGAGPSGEDHGADG